MSSILHYADNLLFFADYPEPVWINPRLIDLFWIVMTPLAPLGFQQMKKGHCHFGAFFLIIYALCNMLSLGHYRYAALSSISTRIHILIVTEAVMGSVLIGYTLMFYNAVAKQRSQ